MLLSLVLTAETGVPWVIVVCSGWIPCSFESLGWSAGSSPLHWVCCCSLPGPALVDGVVGLQCFFLPPPPQTPAVRPLQHGWVVPLETGAYSSPWPGNPLFQFIVVIFDHKVGVEDPTMHSFYELKFIDLLYHKSNSIFVKQILFMSICIGLQGLYKQAHVVNESTTLPFGNSSRHMAPHSWYAHSNSDCSHIEHIWYAERCQARTNEQ